MFAQIQKNETIFIWEREITSKPQFILSLSLFFFVGVASSSCLTPAKVILGLFYILTHDYSLSNWVCTCLHVICFVSLLSYFCVILVVFSFASFVSLCHLLPLNQLPPLPLISLGVPRLYVVNILHLYNTIILCLHSAPVALVDFCDVFRFLDFQSTFKAHLELRLHLSVLSLTGH